MEFWKEVRRQVLTNELSKRGACEKYGLGWHTLTFFPPVELARSASAPTMAE
jgi:hypothetical protein